ncbi:hypothetical protein ZWY2020_037147 [Hordeum vulgare]|nr:hypothetical protein ZWY2020_037147 [Hordeum vulgare]
MLAFVRPYHESDSPSTPSRLLFASLAFAAAYPNRPRLSYQQPRLRALSLALAPARPSSIRLTTPRHVRRAGPLPPQHAAVPIVAAAPSTVAARRVGRLCLAWPDTS